MQVTDTGALSRLLDRMRVEYKIVSDSEAEIYGEISVTRLVMGLAEQGAELIKMHEHDEDLETYFINLVGGAV